MQTEIVRRLAVDWLMKHPTRLAAVYFEGTDTIGHLFAPFVAPPLAGVDTGDVTRFADVPERYYALIDGVIGRSLAALAARSGAVLMIASDHGFQWGSGRPSGLSSVAGATAAKWHREEGIYLLAGPGFRLVRGILARRVAQVAATLLFRHLPAPSRGGSGTRGMRGRLLVKLSRRPRIRERRSPQRALVKIDCPLPTRSSRTAPAVLADGRSAARGLPGRERRGEEPVHGRTVRAPPLRSATRRRSSGRTAEAQRLLLEQALEQEPGDVAAKLNLSNLLFEGDRDAVLRPAADRGVFRRPGAARAVVARAAAWRERGRLDRARSLLLDAAVDIAPANVSLRLFRGRHRIEQGNCQGAAADFSQAVRLEEGRAGSWAALATAQLCLGDRTGARRAFERAVALAPEREELRRRSPRSPSRIPGVDSGGVVPYNAPARAREVSSVVEHLPYTQGVVGSVTSHHLREASEPQG